MNIPIICVALLGFLVIAMGFGVSMNRGKEKRMYGYKEDPESTLYKWIRAHGITVEYAPALMIIIYALGQLQVSGWVVWCMVAVTLCRYLSALGLALPATLAKPNPMRFVGALGTFIFGAILCVTLLIKVL